MLLSRKNGEHHIQKADVAFFVQERTLHVSVKKEHYNKQKEPLA